MADVAHKFKVCLVGDVQVGKSSLLRRFTHNEFSERYLSTIGMNVAKKELAIEGPDGPKEVVLVIYDIMGQRTLREPLKESYFRGAQGILAVCDISRPDTFEGLEEWIRISLEQAGDVPVIVLGNKLDLDAVRAVSAEDLRAIAARHNAPHLETSAKTGQGVEDAFRAVARAVAQRVGAIPT